MKKNLFRIFIVGASLFLIVLIAVAPLFISKIKPGLWVPFFLFLIIVYLLRSQLKTLAEKAHKYRYGEEEGAGHPLEKPKDTQEEDTRTQVAFSANQGKQGRKQTSTNKKQNENREK